ncbi:hypothetical protein Bca4012_039383 [Brassica carinata]
MSSCYVLLLCLGGLLLSWNLEVAKLDWIWIVRWFILIDLILILYISLLLYVCLFIWIMN